MGHVECAVCGRFFDDCDVYPYGDYGEERICGACYGDEYLDDDDEDDDDEPQE